MLVGEPGRMSDLSSPPPCQSPVPELTQEARLGGSQWTQGVGELARHQVEQKGQSEFYRSHHREQMGIPAKSLQLSNNGFFRSLADKRWLVQWSIL